MNRWEKAQMYAGYFLVILIFGALFLLTSICVVVSPAIGIDLILKGVPAIGIPLTIFFSLIAIAYLVLVVSWIANNI